MTYNALDWHFTVSAQEADVKNETLNIIAMFCGETEWISFFDEKCLDALKAEAMSDI
jgi:hypothetical protein